MSSGTPRLVLTSHGEVRVRGGHPWIYRADVQHLDGGWQPDLAVTVVGPGGHALGRGFYNPRPQIVCRLLSRHDEPIDRAFFRGRIEAAWRFRETLRYPGDAVRVVASEGDRLPGLIVDRYGPLAVLQALTLGIESHVAPLALLVAEVTGVRAVYRRTDHAAAAIEGLAGESGWLVGGGSPTAAPAVPAALTAEIEIQEGPCRFRVAIETGQKTGFYLDQRENRERVGGLARGRDVLDAFAYTGAFGVHALVAGARHVLALEASAEACAAARGHAVQNGVADRFEVWEVNAFDALRDLERAGRRFDLVVVDPPPFTRRRAAIDAALRGYKEVNLRALRCLRAGGILATFSCSHHVGPGLFEDVCRAAAQDVGRPVRLAGTLGQARDHPVLLAVPETRYLSGLLLEVLE
jgi:23S rRNA (cytosine1962-C5)-methyltransferase